MGLIPLDSVQQNEEHKINAHTLFMTKTKNYENCFVFIRSWYCAISWVSSVTNAGTVLQNRLPALIHTQLSIHHLGITQVKGKKYGCVVANGN